MFASSRATKSFTMISYGILDCRFTGLYKMLQRGQYQKMINVINETLYSIRTAVETECTKTFMDFIISQLYLMLVDMAFRRYDNVHERIRDIHFLIMDILTPENDEDEIVWDDVTPTYMGMPVADWDNIEPIAI